MCFMFSEHENASIHLKLFIYYFDINDERLYRIRFCFNDIARTKLHYTIIAVNTINHLATQGVQYSTSQSLSINKKKTPAIIVLLYDSAAN